MLLTTWHQTERFNKYLLLGSPSTLVVVFCGCWLLMRMSFGFTQHTSTHSRNKRQAFLTSRDTSSPSQCHKAMVVCFKKEVCQASIFSAFVLFLSLWKQHNMEGGGCQRMVSQPQEKPLTGSHRDEGVEGTKKITHFLP